MDLQNKLNADVGFLPHGPFAMTALTSSKTSASVRIWRIFFIMRRNCSSDSLVVWPSMLICDQSISFIRLKHEFLSPLGNWFVTNSTSLLWSSNDQDAVKHEMELLKQI